MKRRVIELEKMQNDDVDAALKELDEQVELRGLEQLDAKAAAEAATEAQNKQKREYEARLASIRNTLQNTQRQLEEEQQNAVRMKRESAQDLRNFKSQQQTWKNEEEELQSIVQLHLGDLNHEKCMNARLQSDFDQFKQQATALEKELRAELGSSRNVVETVKRDAAQLALEHVRANRMLHAEIAKV